MISMERVVLRQTNGWVLSYFWSWKMRQQYDGSKNRNEDRPGRKHLVAPVHAQGSIELDAPSDWKPNAEDVTAIYKLLEQQMVEKLFHRESKPQLAITLETNNTPHIAGFTYLSDTAREYSTTFGLVGNFRIFDSRCPEVFLRFFTPGDSRFDGDVDIKLDLFLQYREVTNEVIKINGLKTT